MDSNLLSVPVPTNTLWYEYLLNSSLLEKHLQRDNSGKCDKILKMILYTEF